MIHHKNTMAIVDRDDNELDEKTTKMRKCSMRRMQLSLIFLQRLVIAQKQLIFQYHNFLKQDLINLMPFFEMVDFGTGTIADTIDDNSSKLIGSVVDDFGSEDSSTIKTNVDFGKSTV